MAIKFLKLAVIETPDYLRDVEGEENKNEDFLYTNGFYGDPDSNEIILRDAQLSIQATQDFMLEEGCTEDFIKEYVETREAGADMVLYVLPDETKEGKEE